MLIVALSVTFTSLVSAAPHHNWSDHEFHRDGWQRVEHDDPPFRWHEQRTQFSRGDYHMKRMYNHGWQERFPGLRAYQWIDRRGPGFWFRGRHIKEAVMFYDHADELVGVGFMHGGEFIFIRDDDRSFRSHDSFLMGRRH